MCRFRWFKVRQQITFCSCVCLVRPVAAPPFGSTSKLTSLDRPSNWQSCPYPHQNPRKPLIPYGHHHPGYFRLWPRHWRNWWLWRCSYPRSQILPAWMLPLSSHKEITKVTSFLSTLGRSWSCFRVIFCTCIEHYNVNRGQTVFHYLRLVLWSIFRKERNY